MYGEYPNSTVAADGGAHPGYIEKNGLTYCSVLPFLDLTTHQNSYLPAHRFLVEMNSVEKPDE